MTSQVGSRFQPLDPSNRQATFALSYLFGEGRLAGTLRGVPVSPLVLLEQPTPLEIRQPYGVPASHNEANKTVEIAVAFSRFVMAYTSSMPAVEVSSSNFVGVSPDRVFGRPANLYAHSVNSSRQGPVTLSLVSDLTCHNDVTCIAEDTSLTVVPRDIVISIKGGHATGQP